MPNPTPGQLAYTAWWRARCGLPQGEVLYGFARRPPTERAAWEAAAEAMRAWQAVRPEETPMPDDPACADRPSPAFASIEAYGDDPEARVRALRSGVLPRAGQRFALVCTGVVQTDSSVQVQFQLAPVQEER